MSFRSSPPLLERYVLKESILPFILGFGMVTFLFVLDFLFDYLDLILDKGVPPLVVLELFVLALGWIVALSFPCGVLVAALMTFGRLAQDNEISAMRSLGVSMARVLRAPLGASLVMAFLLILFNNYVLPESNHRFANLSLAIYTKAPAAKIEPGVFIDAFDNYSLLVGDVNPRTGDLTDVTIYDYSETSVPTTILAKRGHMQFQDEGSTLRLDLMDGEIHEVPGEAVEGKYRRGKFEEHTLFLRNSGAMLRRADRRGRGEREMNIPMMRAEIRKKEAERDMRIEEMETKLQAAGFESYEEYAAVASPPPLPVRIWYAIRQRLGGAGRPGDARLADPDLHRNLRADVLDLASIDRRIDAYEVEIQKKFSIPFACVVFVLVGAPLGIRTRKGGFANVAIAVGFFIVYYLFLIGGEQLAEREVMSPVLAMWLPNAVFGVVGLRLALLVTGWGPSRGMH